MNNAESVVNSSPGFALKPCELIAKPSATPSGSRRISSVMFETRVSKQTLGWNWRTLSPLHHLAGCVARSVFNESKFKAALNSRKKLPCV